MLESSTLLTALSAVWLLVSIMAFVDKEKQIRAMRSFLCWWWAVSSKLPRILWQRRMLGGGDGGGGDGGKPLKVIYSQLVVLLLNVTKSHLAAMLASSFAAECN